MAAKFPLDDTMQALLLMCTLPDNWENIVVTCNTSHEEENLSLQVVKTSLLNEETRRKDKGVLSQADANVTQHSDRGRNHMPGPSPKVSSHVFIVVSVDTPKRIIDTLRMTKVPQTMSNLEIFLRRKADVPLLQVKKISCSFVRRKMQILQVKSALG